MDGGRCFPFYTDSAAGFLLQVRRGGVSGIPSRNRALELPAAQLSHEDQRHAWAEEENMATYRTISTAFYNFFLLVSEGSLPQTAVGEGVGTRPGMQRNRCRRDCIDGGVKSSRACSPSVTGKTFGRNASSLWGRRSPAHAEVWEGGNRPTSSSISRISVGQFSSTLGSASISSSVVFLGRGTETGGENDWFGRDSKMGAVEFLQDLDSNHSIQVQAARRKQALKAVQQLWADLRSPGGTDITDALSGQETSAEAPKGKGKKVNEVISRQGRAEYATAFVCHTVIGIRRESPAAM